LLWGVKIGDLSNWPIFSLVILQNEKKRVFIATDLLVSEQDSQSVIFFQKRENPVQNHPK
jgi:hypothetical protein